MPNLAEFTAQLARCAQSPEEIRTFVEAFSRVRLRYIASQLAAPAQAQVDAPSEAAPLDWTDYELLDRSGLAAVDVIGLSDPSTSWLHVNVAVDPSPSARKQVQALIAEACLSEKQRKALFPALIASKTSDPSWVERRAAEVPTLNAWLRWARTEGIRPGIFGDYQRHLRIHGASQNAGGNVGAVGGAIAIVDALREILPVGAMEMLGALPTGACDPLSADTFLRQAGLSPNGTERPLKCVLLPNRRAVVFASDPDVAVIQSLQEPFRSAQEAWDTYSEVRSNARLRAQRVHEFAVGEIKTATDPSNLHERMALSTRETRSERQADRFLMMAILTGDLLTGSAGVGEGETRAPRCSLARWAALATSSTCTTLGVGTGDVPATRSIGNG